MQNNVRIVLKSQNYSRVEAKLKNFRQRSKIKKNRYKTRNYVKVDLKIRKLRKTKKNHKITLKESEIAKLRTTRTNSAKSQLLTKTGKLQKWKNKGKSCKTT